MWTEERQLRKQILSQTCKTMAHQQPFQETLKHTPVTFTTHVSVTNIEEFLALLCASPSLAFSANAGKYMCTNRLHFIVL